ncbi:fungal-specific transcription factor domain-containing protein [Dactylonectria macrodidyma]|uniref:Fungal-specific transcription factor domain-containing protein n=1 Tax=Dactylonectria macrodidyma TaxID=307937 RepID=A0A9P9FSC0_9HYPO|nr:fungal-specific transcription factor domain-containing protein [Dactylonectria macrodidyma]
MDDSPGSDRPLKRVKYAQEEEEISIDHSIATLPVNVAAGTITPAGDIPGSFTDDPLFDSSWSLHADLARSPSQLLMSNDDEDLPSWVSVLSGTESSKTTTACNHPAHILAFTFTWSPNVSASSPLLIPLTQIFVVHSPFPLKGVEGVPCPDHAMVDFPAGRLTLHAAPQSAGLNIEHPSATPGQRRTSSRQFVHPSRLPRLLPAVPADPLEAIIRPQETLLHRPPPRILFSPFTNNEDRLFECFFPRYVRPENGQVNGYVKFNWPSRRPSTTARPIGPDPPPVATVVEDVTNATPSSVTQTSAVTLIGPAIPPPQPGTATTSPIFSEASWGIYSSPPMSSVSPMYSQDSALSIVSPTDPRMLPPHFGFQAKMDLMDRRLWDFYIKNWCPGRSVLSNTNLWLTDFAQMHENAGIRCAIQSLAGVYIYDYLPDERIRQRINERYIRADKHFSELLSSPESSEVGKGSEVITMAVILSMQDIILTERRLKKPYTPRWLEGFKQGEHFLHVTDPGGRFWRDNNIQLSNLRISQSIIVGRAVILAQPMMALTSPIELDPIREASRFGWLLYGTERTMYEIHGGCGFSKKLLHTMSQITYCAARLQQEPMSAIVPVTAKYLQRELMEMRQWSRESIPWETARKRPQPIEWIRAKPDHYTIDSDQAMTEATAEAWRFASLIYLQGRLLRLPRNHPELLSNMADLAKCIRIMPTSGSHFTAQAPLLPVFFLGMLATDPDHMSVSQAWFEEVVRTPVRSSVPPLYQALNRIWTWIDVEVGIPSTPTALRKSIGLRYPWWEHLVANVHEREEETLCLT